MPQPPQPQSVRIAVMLMYVGAGLSALGLIVTLVLIGHIRNTVEAALRRAKTATPLTPAQIHSGATVVIVLAIVIALIGIGLWLWMAWANGKGKGWARIVATVFFGLDTLALIFNGSRTATTLIFAGLGWLVGLGALIFLWRRDTTQYIQQQSQFPR
jgi:uncharacterized membrane protein (DUF2068 family)